RLSAFGSAPRSIAHQKLPKRRRRFLWILFCEEMPATKRVARHSERPTFPDAERSAGNVVPEIQRALRAPQDEQRTRDSPASCGIRIVVLAIERRRRPILFTDCVDRLFVLQGSDVSVAHTSRKAG